MPTLTTDGLQYECGVKLIVRAEDEGGIKRGSAQGDGCGAKRKGEKKMSVQTERSNEEVKCLEEMTARWNNQCRYEREMDESENRNHMRNR